MWQSKSKICLIFENFQKFEIENNMVDKTTKVMNRYNRISHSAIDIVMDRDIENKNIKMSWQVKHSQERGCARQTYFEYLILISDP